MSGTSIAIVTDSTASIPDQLGRDLNIHQVAYYIHRGVEVLRDLVTVQRDEFLDWFSTAKMLPKTANPGPGDYYQMYEQLVNAGKKGIISIHMTSKGSGAFQAASLAAKMMKEKLGGDVIIMVTAGASADINPIYRPNDNYRQVNAESQV